LVVYIEFKTHVFGRFA